MSWPAVIVLAVVASCAVVLVARYFLVNRKAKAAASAARRDPSVTYRSPISSPNWTRR
jgi:hypothetical protein